MRLSDAQKQFAYHAGCLLVHIGTVPNVSCTLGDAFRDSRVHGKYGEKKSYSSKNSDHKRRLAIDLNLFIDEIYQTTTEAHRPYGEYWEALHPDNYWGGNILDENGNPDGNHYGRHWPGNNQ